MLKTDTIAFLREILPRLLNDDINALNNEQLLNLRNVYFDDLKRNISPEVIEKFNEFERRSQALIALRELNFSDILEDYNRLIQTAHFESKFPKESQLIILIEIINRSKSQKDLTFIRTLLAKIVKEDISQYNDKTLLALLDCDNKEELTKRLNSIKETLTQHKELHQRANYSFFKGKHSNTIDEFINALDKLISQGLIKENLQLEALTLLVNFHDKLKLGYSVRTLAILKETIINQSEQLEKPLISATI